MSEKKRVYKREQTTAEIEQNEIRQFDFVKSLTFWVFANSFKTYF